MRIIKTVKLLIFIFCIFSNAMPDDISTSKDSILTHNYVPLMNVGILKTFNKFFSAKFNWEYERFSDSKANYLFFQIGGYYKINLKHAQTNICYRILKNGKIFEQRIYMNLTLMDQIDRITMSNSFGLEKRSRQHIDDVFFVKNRITLGYFLKKDKNTFIKPYFTDEVLFDVNRKDSNRNELHFGILTKSHKDLLIDFYYYYYTYFKKVTTTLNYENYVGIEFTFLIPELKRKHKPKIYFHKSHY